MKLTDRDQSPIGRFNIYKPKAESLDSSWKNLYLIGGLAALIAGVIFRRNIGPEISLFCGIVIPSSALDWFTLLQSNRFIGLAFLSIFDLVDYLLAGIMFLSLYVILRETNASHMLLAVVFEFIGIAVYFASNTAFSMLALSDQYAIATTDSQKFLLLAAGEAVLTMGNQGTGILTSFLLLAASGLIVSIIMLQNDLFGRRIALLGILASLFDFIYCITQVFVPIISVFFVSTAGLLLMIWHILIGQKLLILGRDQHSNSDQAIEGRSKI